MATSFLSSETGGFTTFLQRARWTHSGLRVSPQRQRMDFPVLYGTTPTSSKHRGNLQTLVCGKVAGLLEAMIFVMFCFLVLLCFGLEFQEKIVVSSYIFERAPPLVKGGVYFF